MNLTVTIRNASVATHRVMSDKEVWGHVRDVAPAPAMWFFMDGIKVVFTKQWQYYLVAINNLMSRGNIAALMAVGKFAFNEGGIGGTTPRRDYINKENLNASNPDGSPRYPYQTKAYVCTDAQVKVIDGVVQSLDGTKPPTLKPGRVYPDRVEDVNVDDYVYTPRTHPHLFYRALIVGTSGNLSPFPNSALYDWYGPTPVTWMPIVSDRALVYNATPGKDSNYARLAKL